MNTIQVNIGGIGFSLEEEGYRLLKEYLVQLEVRLRENPDRKEIVSDIEARICELILDEQSPENIVSTSLIKEIIEQLGLPDGATSSSDNEPAPLQTEYPKESITRRLYRNPDGAKIGGVCSGLATYFQIEPTIIRLLFCSPLLLLICVSVIPVANMLCPFFGVMIPVSLLLYLILWFAIPKARTPRQRLEMTGSPITAASISQTLSNEMYDKHPSPEDSRSASILGELLFTIGRIVLFCLKAFMLIVAIVLSLVVLFAGIAFIALIVGLFAFDVSWEHPLVLALLSPLVVLLPTATIVYLILRWLFKVPKRDKTFSILTGIWILILIFFGIFLLKEYPHVEDWFDDGGIEWYFEQIRHQTSPAIVLPADTTNDTPALQPAVDVDSASAVPFAVTTEADSMSRDTLTPKTTEPLTNP